MRSRKLLALIFSLLAIAPALAGYMTLLGAGVGSIQPAASWVSTTDPTFPSSSLTYSGPSLSTMFDSTGKLTYKPNNLALNTATLGTQSVTVQVGVNYLISFASGGGSIALSGAGAGTVTSASPVKITASTTTLTLTVTGTVTNAVVAAVTYETTPRTADQVITTSAAYYGPRIDYDPNTLAIKGLLIEEARPNYAFPSQAFAAFGSFGLTISDNTAVSPTGATNATTLTATAGANQHDLQNQWGGVASGVTTVSYFVKQGTNRWIALAILDAATWRLQTFDMQNGVKGTTTSAGVTSTITALASGWYRISVTYTTTAANPYVGLFLLNGDNSTLSWTAAGTETLYAFGVQLELGSFPTSYIATAASSVTRAADVVQFTGAALTALQGSAGSAIVQTSSLAANSANPQTFIGTQNISFVGNSLWYWPANTKMATANASQNLSTTNSHAIGSPLRAGVAWSGAGRSVASNGVASATDANPFVSTAITSAYLGSANGGVLYWLNGWVQSFAIYNQRLSDATLQARSVVGASYAANDNVNPFAPQFAANDNLPVHWRIAL